MDILDVIKNRRSIRKFNNSEINKQELNKIIEAGMMAPTAMNKEECIIFAVSNKEMNEKAAEALMRANLSDSNPFYDSKIIIHVAAKRDSFNAISDCTCIMENMWLEASSLNIGAVWINGMRRAKDTDEVIKFSREINLPEDYMICSSLALGRSDEEIHFIKEKNKKLIFID